MGAGWKILLGVAAVFGIRKVVSSSKPEENSETAPAKRKLQSILFVGDSNTFYSWSYADQFAKAYPKIRAKKISKIGAKTDWMLKELKNELLKTRYDVVSVLGGSNDIYAEDKNSNAKKNLEEIYRLAKTNGAEVLAITPPNKDFFVRRTEHKQILLRDLITWINNNPSKDHYINFYEITNDKNFFTKADGYLHAQKPAHTLLLKRLTNILNFG